MDGILDAARKYALAQQHRPLTYDDLAAAFYEGAAFVLAKPPDADKPVDTGAED